MSNELKPYNELTVYEGQKAVVEAKRMNYQVSIPGGVPQTLKRDVDFGVIQGTKKPSLFKSGAEKICFAYGLMQRYYIESKAEAWGEAPFFYYLVRCDLVKLLPTGQEIVFTSGYGSSNTKERRNGFNGAYDAANTTLKMAQKRALTSAAISICGGSDLFTQDIEDESFVTKNYEEIKKTQNDDAPVTAKQIKRLYAIGGEVGRTADDVINLLKSKGYASTKDIKQKDYDEICKLVGTEDAKVKTEQKDRTDSEKA